MTKEYTQVTVRRDVKDAIAKVLKQRKMSWTDLLEQIAPTIRDLAIAGEGSTRLEAIIKVVFR